ncbi:putative mitogen-activated protein kinase kinase kinase STE-STE11 family [Rosa chinensis]|uniref:mitogen-activated protein kinase kinase kinase n=1 Tax=Rosa chinensis TaxID=74649 RepID=A0A2P6RSD3_ROSCH|nr:mitogen-activated protein kinase kinase kinase 3 [Rosa chinensis]PRQ49339.1 putative mitogen-activated protein kinase kinase kinase STE-STE11 family [Rosa chinensis]
MPAWWGRKSSKTKTDAPDKSINPYSNRYAVNAAVKSPPIKTERGRSFDEPTPRGSPRVSKDLGTVVNGSTSGFSGFDSDGGGSKGHPLPRPSLQGVGNDQGIGLGSASGSVSSGTSSVSSSDEQPIVHDPSQFGAFRVNGEPKFSMMPRSPGPGSRGPTSPTSPLHARLGGMSLESPTGKLDDGKSICHPLPLPPGSPTSPSSLSSNRTTGVTESIASALSKWKKGRLLGRGTFGHVYVGFNSESGQMCAIKEVRLVEDQSLKECLKQLNQEINLLSQLSHPNIVRYHGSELGDEALSVYLEYVSGGSIHKLLQEYGAFKEPVIQNYTRQILSGLAYLHGRNTVHRDIKGANILVDPNGEIKLADFGMAKHITNVASMLSFKGSPYWMAPEVVMNTNGYSLAVDIWSLGCTILEMATSKPPWSQYEGVAAIFKIGNSKDMPDIPDYLSHDAKNFVRLCLQRNPSERPTASQLLDHPFIREQMTTRSSNIKLTKDAFPYAFDGSRTPPILELHSNRTSITLCDADHITKPAVTSSRAIWSPRENARITSLPVSPCSSPLRQYGPAHKSCFLSPPHPTYAMMGQSNYNLNEYSSYTTRPNTSYTLEPWRESPMLRPQTPSGSPRTRPI